MNSQELLEANSHMPTAEVKRDIHDTEVEIAALEAMSPGVAVLEDRVLRMRVDSGISRRKKFVTELKRLLEARGEPTNSQPIAG